MLFVKTAGVVLPAEILREFLAAFYIPSIAVFFLGMLLARYFFQWKTEELSIAGIISCYGNLVLLGLPTILSSFSRDFLILALILIAFQSMVLFGITIFWLNAFILAEQYQLREDTVSKTIILSTTVSVGTITALLNVFGSI